MRNALPALILTLAAFSQPGAAWRADSGARLGAVDVAIDESGHAFFAFPSAAPGVGYVTREVDGLPENASTVAMAYTIAATGAPVFDYRTAPDNRCGKGYPGAVRLFIQRAGDDESGQGAYRRYRYWAVAAVRELAPGAFTLSARLDPAQWSDVVGAKGSDNPEMFRQALRNAGRIGMTFGGGCFYGHGVFTTGGAARFTIDRYSVQ